MVVRFEVGDSVVVKYTQADILLHIPQTYLESGVVYTVTAVENLPLRHQQAIELATYPSWLVRIWLFRWFFYQITEAVPVQKVRVNKIIRQDQWLPSTIFYIIE